MHQLGQLGSRIANNEGGIDQLGRDLGAFKQQMDSYSKVKEQLENLRLEFEEFKVNLSGVANDRYLRSWSSTHRLMLKNIS